MRRRRPYLTLLGLGLLLLAGAALLHHRSATGSDALLRTGTRAVGTVVQHGHAYKGRDYVVVRFPLGADGTYDGRLYTYADHPDGSSVEVWFDPAQPSRFRTRAEANLKDGDNAAVWPLVALGGSLSFAAVLAPLVRTRTAAR